jgi:signal transduction histidine kinase
MKDEFVSTVSHELRTPLTSIRGALAILSKFQSSQLDARGQQMLDMAGKNAERLTTLINDILDVEKAGLGTLFMNAEPVDLRDVLRDATDQTASFAAAHEIELKLDLIDAPLSVTGDAGRLHQAVVNLISNACKYSPRDGLVRICGRIENADALILVEDAGPGIPIEFRPHIFGRFAQAGADHQQGRAGSGLGLAITKAIIEQHGGTIGFDTELGSGSCFWIRLALRKEQA